MDSHLDALGYLLAAVVFSVGFLSGRVHSNLDSTTRAVGERSWRVRQAISEGGRLGPADLADLLGVVHGSTDYVAAGSRILNWAIFSTTLAVFVDALVLFFSGTEAPDHVMVVLTLLFAASLAVVVFSEFDVRRVSLERQREIDASTLGRLQKLAKLMATEDIPRASRELSRLRETFPTWGLLVELEAYLDLLMNRPRDGLDQIESLIDSDGDLHVSPIVGAACCLELDGLDSALELLTRIERRGGSDDYPGLHRALAVNAGHLSALLASRDYPSLESSEMDRNAAHSVTQELIGEEIEKRREPVRNLAFELDPAKIPQTSQLVATLGQWEHGSTLRGFDPNLALSKLLTAILEPTKPSDTSAALQSFAIKCRDPLTLESFGLVAFASGEPRTALGFFEAAIRLAPAAARSHWGRAIACHRVGWLDAAWASLRRVATLSDDVPLLSITRRMFQENAAPIDPLEATNAYPLDMDDMDRFELALLGIKVDVEDGASIQRRFISKLVALALANNQRAAPV